MKLSHRLFKFIWRKRFKNEEKLIRIRGWNRCVYDTKMGDRINGTYLLFKWMK